MDNMILYLVIILGIIAFVQLIRVYELSETLKGNETEEVTEKENRLNGRIMLLAMFGFFVFFIYQFMVYKELLLPEASSVHGPGIDGLFNVTTIIITTVFFATHALLAWFAFSYYHKAGRKATFFPHNTKLEVVWTIIPSIVLIGLIVYGMTVWSNVMYADNTNAHTVEVYGKQFQWLARYPGKDQKLGGSYFKRIGGANELGLDSSDNQTWDDIITKELHLPVNKPVQMIFRSQEVIHSAYMPHFRVQMNCVPGMATHFTFTPTKTTAQMRTELQDEKFDYYLLCNKICGAAHYMMKMNVVVDSEEDYQKWISEQRQFIAEQPAIQGEIKTAAVKDENSTNKTTL